MPELLNPTTHARKALGLHDRPRVVPQLNLTEFKHRFYPDYEHALHLELFDRHLEQVVRYVETDGAEGIRFLVVEMPPRHGKSLTLSKLLMAWFLGRNPDMNVILVSNAASLAEDHAYDVRRILETQEWRDLYQLRIAEDRSSLADWKIAGHQGGMRSVGIGSRLTGRGANLLVCDDLVSGRLEVESATQREKLWTTLMGDIYQRQQPNCAMVLNATRWHEDDPSGRVIERWPEHRYTRLHMPAIAGPDDMLGRQEGDALWPAWWPLDALDERAEVIGPYEFSAQYQQTPTPPEGSAWKREWLRHRPEPDHSDFSRIVVGVDPAGTANPHSSETGIVVCGLMPNDTAWVLDDCSMKGTPDQWARAILAAVERWQADYVVVEVNFGGDMVANTIRTLDQNVFIKEVRASRGKHLRAEPVMARYEQGHVIHSRVYAELERQMLTWVPGQDSPDRMDALVWALTDILGIEPPHGNIVTGTHNLWGAFGSKRGPQ